MIALIESLALPEKAKRDAAEVYRLLAEAESRAHGRPVGEVHFHEVGALDAVADVAAACWLVSELAPDEIVASSVNVGGGVAHCAHGVLPVPTPATAFLLEGVSAHGDDELRCELCTPTGAALLRHFAVRFGSMPEFRVTATGYGAGKRDFERRANLLRCMMGGDADEQGAPGEVWEIACNIDDMTGEEIAFACERIFAAGALDVTTVPVTMKKGRPGVVLLALCADDAHGAVAEAVFLYTSTLGIREHRCRRYVLQRREDSLAMPDGTVVRMKSSTGCGVVRTKYEYDDLAEFARREGVSLAEARTLVSSL